MSDPPTPAIGQSATVHDGPTPASVQPSAVTDRLYDLPEAAKLTGLTVDALRKRASRGKLEHVKGNDGTVRIRLTTAALDAIRREAPSHSPDLSGLIELHERASRAEGEAAILRDTLVRVQGHADAATEMATARSEALQTALLQTAIAEERANAAAKRAADAEARLARTQADLTEARTPWAVRIIRAWRSRDGAGR